MKLINKGKIEVKYSVLKLLSKFWSFDTPWWHHQPKSGSKSSNISISSINVDRKTKVKSKRNFEMNYLFMKPFSQNFEVLTQLGDIIKPKLAWKRAQTSISCTNDGINLQMYLFLWNFSLNGNSLRTFTSTHFGHFWYKIFTRSVLILKFLKIGYSKTFLIVHIDLVVIFLPHIVFDI